MIRIVSIPKQRPDGAFVVKEPPKGSEADKRKIDIGDIVIGQYHDVNRRFERVKGKVVGYVHNDIVIETKDKFYFIDGKNVNRLQSPPKSGPIKAEQDSSITFHTHPNFKPPRPDLRKPKILLDKDLKETKQDKDLKEVDKDLKMSRKSQKNVKEFLAVIGPDNCKIFLIDGDYVRTNIFVDFTLGGHYYRYPKFVPENEIWVEKTRCPRDIQINLTHEIIERILMKFSKVSYEDAHSTSASIEWVLRHIGDNEKPTFLDIDDHNPVPGFDFKSIKEAIAFLIS